MVLFSGAIAGQTSVSPYSIFGNGERESGRFAQQTSLGGISAGLRDPLQLNPGQPASYSSLQYTTIEFGGFLQRSWLSDANQTVQTDNGGFNYLAFGFPISEKIGLSVGVMPYSKVGYDVHVASTVFGEDAVINYQGDGGFDRAYFGLGYEIFKGFSLGVNGSYFFGTTERITTTLIDNNAFYDVSREQSLNTSGLSWDAGLQYVKSFGADDKYQMVLGATYVPKTMLGGTLNDLSYTFLESSTGSRTYKDTVYGKADEEVDVIFNSNMSFGLTFGGRS